MKVQAYTDGSYNEARKTYGGGIVIIGIPGMDAIQTTITGNDIRFIQHRNISGELFAVIKAMELLDKFADVDEVDLFYDYAGIEHWVTGVWQAKKAISILYLKHMSIYVKRFKINFHKVKAHAGDYYNNIADGLARSATFKEPSEVLDDA